MMEMYVTYRGNEGDRFDGEYWTKQHFHLVRDTWGPHGLESIAGFFPAGGRSGFVAIAVCVFTSEAAMSNALSASETSLVMDDVKRFTDIVPRRSKAANI